MRSSSVDRHRVHRFCADVIRTASFAFVVLLAPAAAAQTRSLDDYRYYRALSIDLAGRMPTRSEIADFETLMGHVACGLGVTILCSPFEKIAPPGVVFKPIVPTELALQVSACWRRRDENPLVQSFLKLMGVPRGARADRRYP